MRVKSQVYIFGALLFCAPLFADPAIILPTDITIGRNLETFASVKLSQPAPAEGVSITLVSDDPLRLLFSHSPGEKGTPTITLKVNSQYTATPDFFLQGFADSGSATYTASAPGYGSARGSVVLAPSALLIVGPFRSSEFKTTPHGPIKVSVISALIDKTGDPVVEQPVAGGLILQVPAATSDPKVGAIFPTFKLLGGESSADSEFRPASVGKTVVTLKPSEGFALPARHGSLSATVELPGIGITGDLHLGKDLELGGVVLLGEPAPAEGLDVTLTSDEPQKMILSADKDQPGAKAITLHIKAGESKMPYFVQGLADSGIVNYTATAHGYRTRTAPIGLTPSGVMVVFSAYEAPDEAEYLRASLVRDPRPFTTSLSDKKPVHLSVWTVFLDPNTHRGADMTAQRLRAGVKAKVELENSNPAVAEVASSLVLDGASDHVFTQFKPLSTGQTTISVRTPSGFTTPSNATSVTATIKE